MRTLLTTGLAALLIAAAWPASALAAGQEPIVFADASWESIQFHNRVAGFIVEHGYGRPVDYIFGDTLPSLHGLVARRHRRLHGGLDRQASGRRWSRPWRAAGSSTWAPTSPMRPRVWYVPTYMIEGDPERGIEP